MDDTYSIPETFETERFVLRRITPDDAPAIFEAYAQDRAVTLYLGWRPHTRIDDTRAFVREAAREWQTGRGFPLVVSPRVDPDNLTGMFHPHVFASTVNYGYVLAGTHVVCPQKSGPS